MIVCVAVLSFYHVVTYYLLEWDIFQLVGHHIMTTSDLPVGMGHRGTRAYVGIRGLCVSLTPQTVEFHTDFVSPLFPVLKERKTIL